MKMSRTIAYAINAVLQLGRETPGVPVSCTQLAEVGELPKRFLLQILRRLVMHEVLSSTRGAEGGYYLARPPAEVTLCDIVDAFDASDVDLPALPGLAPTVRSLILDTLQDVVESSRTELSKVSLADLLAADGTT
jgi:Rrf2 family transcriptional regulator, cysteine metabolism repressor